jgi:hypothetical protein
MKYLNSLTRQRITTGVRIQGILTPAGMKMTLTAGAENKAQVFH